MIVITQHVFKRRDALSADCRPPTFVDEGSVNLTRYHHPALRQVIDVIPGMAGVIFALFRQKIYRYFTQNRTEISVF